ncbi:SoxR reducing system RseC family protein [bacterium]|nr:SoxR reducing system RseC family protein [bacterium]
MREAGQVIAIHQGFAEIKMSMKGGCASCHANGMCHISGTGVRTLTLPLRGFNVEVGDYVEIETPARSLLSASFIIFILPLLVSGLAYFIISANTANQEFALLGFFGCFLLALLLIMFLDRFFGRRAFFEPKITGKSNHVG